MKNLTSLALVALSTNLLVACVTGDNLPPDDVQTEPEPIRFPSSCAQLAQANASATDGEHTLYLGNDEAEPWTAYCVDMSGAATEYLTLPQGGAANWSQYRAGGQTVGTDVETRFDKVRIDPITLKLDISDQTFAVSTGAIAFVGGEVTSMPLGVAMTCGGGYATAQVDVGGTPFLLENQFAVAGAAGAHGNADLWSSGQVLEMWADGDCGWIAPATAPTKPMNHAGGFAISLTYHK